MYKLDSDVSESKDVSGEHPEIAKELKAKLAAWRDRVSARISSPPLLTDARQLYFADHFSTGQVSKRWFFNKDWSAENGVLQRSDDGTNTTRIFLRDAKYRDVIVRFDFQLQQSKDIRLVTGGGGNYNAVIHIRPDHFYVQTAMDKSGPYFSYRHGECAFNFEPKRWYSMTVEFIGDQLIAHIDREHLVYAKHPILDKERSYFAFQVDSNAVALDNVQVLQAVKHREQETNLKHIKAAANRFPVKLSLKERFDIQKTNAHEWFYQRHEAYRELVKRVDALEARNKKLFPEVFRSHKEFQKKIAAERKRLQAEDSEYKETLFATFRANRAIESYLYAQSPEVEKLPDSRRKRELERLRIAHQNDTEYKQLVKVQSDAQDKLKSKYPQLFKTNEEITEYKKQQRQAAQSNPEFKKAINERAAAWRAREDYLLRKDKILIELQELLDMSERERR